MEAVYRYDAYVLDVHDGDTYKLRVDLGFHASLVIQCRLHGVDCPELNTQEGKLARAFVVSLFHPAIPIVIESYKDQRSFERWVCDVWLDDGRSLADVLVAEKYATKYPKEK